MEFKKYLRGVGDAGTRLLFKFRSGTHGLNEELGRHRGRECRKECLLYDAECESVSHVLWDCPAYVSIRSAFMLELRRELGDRFEHFQSLDSFEKSDPASSSHDRQSCQRTPVEPQLSPDAAWHASSFLSSVSPSPLRIRGRLGPQSVC